MENANQRQVAGTHYKSEYQHWDLVCDTNMPYVLGCATKYLARWRKKNGVQDLEKAIHYIEKAKERKILMEWTLVNLAALDRFIELSLNNSEEEGLIFREIYLGNYNDAIEDIRMLMSK